MQYLKQAYLSLMDILEKSKVRSLLEHRLYWLLMTWCGNNTPDNVAELFDVDTITKEFWHELCKSKFSISSTAFDRMNEYEFNQYFQDVINWLAMMIFKCKINDIMDNLE
jgi:hypothetical protein